jgi:hypothetical protein
MKPTFIYSILFTILLITQGTNGQELGVQKIYYKVDNVTVVKTPTLPIVDTPTQLVQLQLIGRSPKKQETGEPHEKITLTLDSHASASLYQKDDDRKLLAIADGEVLNLGLLSYHALKSTPGGPQGDYVLNPAAGWIMRVPISPGMAVFAANKNSPLLLESMYLDLPLEQLTKIVNAKRLEIRFGQTAVVLTDTNMRMFAQFLQGLMSPNGATIDSDENSAPDQELGEVSPNAPSDSNGAPLNQTIEWIRNEISLRASTKAIAGVPLKVKAEAKGASECEIRYRISDAERTSAYDPQIYGPVKEFVIKLADLNPEAVKISDSSTGETLISLATLDRKQTIEKLVIEYGSGRILARTNYSDAFINLRKTKSASHIGDAIIHAINLCQLRQ